MTRASKISKGEVSFEKLSAAAQEVQLARKEMQEAFLESPKAGGGKKYDAEKQTTKYKRAKKRYDVATGRYSELSIQASTKLSDDSEQVLDQIIASAQAIKKQSEARLNNVVKAINVKGFYKVDPKNHQVLVKQVMRVAPLALEERGLISALSVALREQAVAYDKLSKFIEETPEARRGLSLSATGGISKAAELYRKTAEEGAAVGDILRADGWTSVGPGYVSTIPVGIKGIKTAEEFGEKLKDFKTAREAAEFIVKNAEDASYRAIATRILDEIPDIPFYLIDNTTSGEQLEAIAKQASVRSVNDIMKGRSRGLLYSDAWRDGPKVPKGILIRGHRESEGRNVQTVIHELMHAATTAKIYEFKDFQKLKDSPEYHKVYKDLSSIHVYARKALRESRNKADAQWGTSALKNIDELVAWGFTNPEFRDFLKTVKMPGKNNTAWSKFVEAITRMLGLNERIADGSQTALDRLLRSVDELLDLPAPARAVPEPSAAAKAAPKDLPTGNLDNLPEHISLDISRITGGTSTKPIYEVTPTYATNYKHYDKGDKVSGWFKLEKVDKTFTLFGDRDRFNKAGLPIYRANGGLLGVENLKGPVYEYALQFLNKIHPEGFVFEKGYASLEESVPKAIKVVNGKIIDEAEGFISRMAADVPINEATRKADDMYMIEQVELLTGWLGKGAKEGDLAKDLNWLQRTIRDFWRKPVKAAAEAIEGMWDPASRALGPASEAVHQIGISTLSAVKKVQQDIVIRISPAAEEAGEEAAQAAIAAGQTSAEVQKARIQAETAVIISFITSPESISGSIMNTIFDGRSLWDMAKPMLRATSGITSEEPEMAVNSLAKMWIPPGEAGELSSDIIKQFNLATRNLLMYGQVAKPKPAQLKDPAELQKLLDAGKSLSYADFSEGMKNAVNSIFKGAGSTDKNIKRVNYFAAQAIAQMALLNMASTRMNKLLANFSEDAIDAAARLAAGDSLKPGQDLVEATKVLNQLKVPANLRKLGTQANDQIKTGLAMYTDGYGYKAIVPHEWMTKTSELLSKIEKTAEAFSAKEINPAQSFALDTFRGIYRIWHSSILTGLFIPRAAYFTNIYVGNFGQLLAYQGFTAAATYAGTSAKDVLFWAPQHLARQTPMGKYVDAALDKMDAKFGTKFHLSSLTNALLNKNISMIVDPSLASNSTKIVGKGGKEYRMGDLRRMAVEQGIFSSFVSGSGLSNLMVRADPRFKEYKTIQKIKESGTPMAKAYADFADTLEQRQRVGLFSDLVINKGMSAEEAGKIVRGAFYDWDSPMSKWETFFANKIFMFYNFTRRAMGQGMRILLDPYLESAKDTAAEGVLRSSPFLSMVTGKPAYKTANVMAMERTRRETSEYLTEEDTAAEYPWWAKKAANKMFLPNSPMGQVRSDNYSRTLGKDVNYKVTTVPSITPIEMINQWGDMVRILGGYAVSSVVDTPAHIIGGARPSQVNFQEDVLFPMMEKLAEQAGPFSEDAIAGIMEGLGKDKTSYLSEGVNVNRLSDRKILEWLEQMGPFMSGIAWEDAKNPGRLRTTPGTLALLKAIPGVSNEINTLIGPYLDVTAEGGEASEVLKETLGLLRVQNL